MSLSNNPFHKGTPGIQTTRPQPLVFSFSFGSYVRNLNPTKTSGLETPLPKTDFGVPFLGSVNLKLVRNQSESHDPKQLVVGLYKRDFL